MAYQCYKLTPEARQKLLEKFPPKYPEVRYGHITIQMCDSKAPKPKSAQSVCLTGLVDDNQGIQTFLVEIDGSPVRPSDQAFWHLTASFDSSKKLPLEFLQGNSDENYRSKTSNAFLKQILDEKGVLKKEIPSKWSVQIFKEPILIETIPMVQMTSRELKQISKTR